MSLLRSSLPAQKMSDFLASLPPPPPQGYFPQSVCLQQLIAELMASELIHRELWKRALARNPGTLLALKQGLDL